jgi:asparagine synthase (glutamine-hydrolysing)
VPGIVGLITRMPRRWAEPQLLSMLEAMAHEPFYSTGTWVDEGLGAYVGWTARKGSFSDGMPIRNERGDVLVFAGEDFPDPGTRQRLSEHGHRFDIDGPGYLAHLLVESPQSLTQLNGWFHGLVAERSRGTTTLFNDRYGLQRLYYHLSADAVYFAAEAKAILAVRPELRRLDPRGLAEFVTCGCVMEDRTLFPGIRVLPGASAWTFRRGELARRGAYFSLRDWDSQGDLEPEAFYRELKGVLARVVPGYFRSHQPVAVSLTGGIDTRVLIAMQKPAPGSLPCYTFGGMIRDSQDVRVARRLAATCGQPHEVIRVGSEFLAEFPRYAERTVYLTDGCVDVGHSADLYVNERAREIAPVRITGNYGGEVLRRVVAFRPKQPWPDLFQPELRQHALQAEETYREASAGHPVAFAAFRQAPWHHYGLLALEQSQLTLRSPYLDNHLVRAAFRAPMSALVTPEVCARLVAEESRELSRLGTDRGPADARRDLAARAARRLIGIQRKAEYAYDYGMPQILARVNRLLEPLRFDHLFLGRHKFVHYRAWYRDALSGYVQEVLLDARSLRRSYVGHKALETIVREHVSGRANYTTEIHKLLTLELIQRLFVDR